MKDPTLAEMLTFLASKFHYHSETPDDFEIAAHYFADRWHGGMWSNLYGALCEINYDAKDTEPSEDIEEMVKALETEFASSR